MIDVNEELIKNYRREVRYKLKEQSDRIVEDVDKTLMLKGEMKAINKILRLIKSR